METLKDELEYGPLYEDDIRKNNNLTQEIQIKKLKEEIKNLKIINAELDRENTRISIQSNSTKVELDKITQENIKMKEHIKKFKNDIYDYKLKNKRLRKQLKNLKNNLDGPINYSVSVIISSNYKKPILDSHTIKDKEKRDITGKEIEESLVNTFTIDQIYLEKILKLKQKTRIENIK